MSRDPGKQLSRSKLFEMFTPAWESMSIADAKNSFSRPGIWPVNRHAISNEDIKISETFNQNNSLSGEASETSNGTSMLFTFPKTSLRIKLKSSKIITSFPTTEGNPESSFTDREEIDTTADLDSTLNTRRSKVNAMNTLNCLFGRKSNVKIKGARQFIKLAQISKC